MLNSFQIFFSRYILNPVFDCPRCVFMQVSCFVFGVSVSRGSGRGEVKRQRESAKRERGRERYRNLSVCARGISVCVVSALVCDCVVLIDWR